MKVLKLTTILLSIALLCSGCQAVTPAADQDESIMADKYEEVEAIDSSTMKKVNIPGDASVICSYDDYIIYITEVKETEQAQSDKSYNINQLYRYNMQDESTEHIVDMGRIFSMSGEAEYMDGKIYYPCTDENEIQRMLEIDLEKKTIDTVFESETWAPFYYMEKCDDVVIFYNITRPDAFDTVYTVYTIKSQGNKKVEKILETKASDAVSDGEYIVHVKAYNNSIYTYGAVYNNESTEWDYHIKSYDIDGNQLADYELDSNEIAEFEYMPEIDDYDTVWNFDICDSYIILHTLNKRIKMFKMNGSRLLNIQIPQELYKEEAGSFEMISGHASDSGLLYTAACYLSEKNLYIFDTKQAKFKVYTVPMAEDERMNILYDTPDGKLIIKIEQITDEGYENPRIYMLDANKLQ